MKKSEANKEIHFRTRYDRTQDDGISFDPEDTFVKQYFKDECDINNILNRFEKTGITVIDAVLIAYKGEMGSIVL